MFLVRKKNYFFDNSFWTRFEKWTLIWGTAYAKLKHKKQRECSQEWLNIFQHHCPKKKDYTRAKLIKQKANILCSKEFSNEQIEQMENRADTMVKDSICPLQHPIIMPEPAQIDQHSLHETVDQTAQNLTVENTCQNQQENENPTDLGNNELENDQINLNFSLDTEPTTEEKYKKIEEEILNVIEEIKRIPIEKRPVLIKLQIQNPFRRSE